MLPLSTIWFPAFMMLVLTLFIFGFVILNTRLSKKNKTVDAEAKIREGDIGRKQSNYQIYQQKLLELDELKNTSVISTDEHQQLIREAKLQYVADAEQIGGNVNQLNSQGKGIILASIFGILFVSGFIYSSTGLSLGSGDHFEIRKQLERVKNSQQQQIQIKELEKLIKLIEQYKTPFSRDVPMNHLLVEAYKGLGKYNEAIGVLDELVVNVEQDSEMHADYLAMKAEFMYLQDIANAGQQVAVRPVIDGLLEQALSINTNQLTALNMSGMSAFLKQNWEQAISYWERALVFYPPGQQAQLLQQSIATAKQRAGTVQSEENDTLVENKGMDLPKIASAIKLKVDIDPSVVKEEDNQQTPVFVFARPSNGMRMPLAVKRLTLADLPAEVILTEANLMAGRSIDGEDSVLVSARLSRSGQPVSSPGDSEAEILLVEVIKNTNSEELDKKEAVLVTINKVVGQ